MKLLITIDTECDNAWSRNMKVTTDNTRFLPRFQSLCERFGFKPTYVCTHEIAQDDGFVEFGRDAIKRSTCEIGSHPHAWTCPPIKQLTSNDMLYHPWLIEFPESLMREKLRALTDLLEERFEVKMYSHRAGRWGFNATYANLLDESGYEVDCSVTPFLRWSVGERAAGEPDEVKTVDYRFFRTEPYYLDAEDISQAGSLSLLEIPVTVIGHYSKLVFAIYSRLPGRILPGVVRRVCGRPYSWFRPDSVYRELMRVAEIKVAEKADYIMFMLHSSEFMPGGSPTFKDEKDIERLYDDITEAFEYLHGNGVTGATCHEFYERFRNNK